MGRRDSSGRILFLVSGPSGAGKRTLIQTLLQTFPDMRKLVTYTSRPPRPDEIDGQDYWFITVKEFERKMKAGELLEWTHAYGDHLYGTPKDILQQAPETCDVILEVDVWGKEFFSRLVPDSVSIFIRPPSVTTIEHRIVERSRLQPNAIQRRLRTAEEQLRHAVEYDYVVNNDDLQRAKREIVEIVQRERAARRRLDAQPSPPATSILTDDQHKEER